MEWIKVEDQLPKDTQKIKFKGHFPFECQGFFERSGIGYQFFHMSCTEDKKIYRMYGVTHWASIEEN